MDTHRSWDVCSTCWSPQNLQTYWPWSWCGFQTVLMAACEHCRKTSAKHKRVKVSGLRREAKSSKATPSSTWIHLQKTITKSKYLCSVVWRGLEDLVEERVVPPLDPGPVGLSTHVDLHHRFDVVPRELTGLNDPNTNLREKKKKNKGQNKCWHREATNTSVTLPRRSNRSLLELKPKRMIVFFLLY